MPVQPRSTDTYTRDNLLLGFSQVEFTPKLTAGGYGTPIPLGILSGQELQKEIELLELPRGDAGLITIERELVSRLAVSLQLETFNFRADLAQLLLASSSITPVTAAAAQAVVNELVNVPSGSNAARTFTPLSKADIDEATVVVDAAPLVDEAVGTGNGTLGGTTGDYALDYKILVIGDVTEFLVGGVDETVNLVAGTTPTAGQIAISVGATATSGQITFGSSKIPANGAAIVASYEPSFNLVESLGTANPDVVIDPLLGRLRFPDLGSATSELKAGQPVEVDYNYNRKASNTLKPFTQTQFEGKATIKHLTDVGVNFVWDIPSASIRITDDALTFDAEDFAVGTMIMNVLDAGGTDRFGTLNLSSEPEQLA